MRFGLSCLAVAAVVIIAVWTWLGSPVPQSPLAAGEQVAGQKLYCMSYAPYRDGQNPFDPTTFIPAAQIDEDLTQLSKITNCVRVYSADQGLEQVAGLAAKHGMKVLQGIWLSSKPDKNRLQIENGIALANKYPDTIMALVVGNEVLLRGEMSAIDLGKTIREVKSRVHVPVTYADVWEFWLRNRELASDVDFVTIHVLPYWEDFPVPASEAAAHVDAIRRQVVAAFPGKEVLIGEVGWPSAGRMREGALPSLANEGRVIQDVLALAKRDHFHVNVIEAFDAPWKRALEGTVGGHWGILDAGTREPKFVIGEAISNHPRWKLQAAGGVVFAVLIFAAALAARRKDAVPGTAWLAVGANAITGGILTGWAIENVPIESLSAGGWLRSLAFCAVALASPLVVSAAIARGSPLPVLSRVVGPAEWRTRDRLALLAGIVMVVTLVLSVDVALGLVFNPRYKDFPFAPLTAAIVPFLVQSLSVPRPSGGRGIAELAAALILSLSVIYIVPNESLANWQSVWLCTAFAALAISLFRVRDVPG
jgi:exo-beta-1,3-glucanase (GH17 family)